MQKKFLRLFLSMTALILCIFVLPYSDVSAEEGFRPVTGMEFLSVSKDTMTFDILNKHILRQGYLAEGFDANDNENSLDIMDSYMLKQIALGQTATSDTIYGIDVSRWQGNINWASVRSTNVSFVMFRAGYGKSIDPKFYEYINGAKSYGFDCGIYWFSYATTVEEAVEEAEKCIDTIKDYKLEYPIVFDYEYDSMREIKDTVTPALVTDMAVAFMNTLEQNGYYAMYYSNRDFIDHWFDGERMKSYDFWYARPRENAPDLKCGIWQYSFTGSISGINADVDLDVSYKDYPAIMKKAHLNGY